MSINKSFQGLPKIVQFILLIIPGLNWWVEIIVRVSAFCNKQGGIGQVILAIIPITGVILGYIDLIYVLVKGRLVLTK